MNSSLTINNVVRFFVLLLVQVLILQRIDVSTYINIFIYPMFILLLPVRTPHWLVIFLSFCLGLMIDVFYTTYGMHAAVSTLTAYLRGLIMRLIEPRGGYTSDRTPNRRMLGDGWYMQYAALFVAVHLFVLIVVENIGARFTGDVILRFLLTYIISLGVITLPQFIFPVKR
jgi:predicted neutral ceramidase superfamily lipid hydrolase